MQESRAYGAPSSTSAAFTTVNLLSAPIPAWNETTGAAAVAGMHFSYRTMGKPVGIRLILNRRLHFAFGCRLFFTVGEKLPRDFVGWTGSPSQPGRNG
jgi:hypothetical protein